MLEIVRSAGLDVFIGSQPINPNSQWCTRLEPGFWFGINLQGRITIDGTADMAGVWGAGASGCFWLETAVDTHHSALSGGELSGVFVRVAMDAMESIAGSEGLEAGMKAGCPATLRDERKTDRVMQMLGWQMFGCPLAGVSRRCYLAGKALEIIAQTFETAADVQSTSSRNTARHRCLQPTRAWSPGDIERLHHARALVLAQLSNPPTVVELARAVGLNSRKLGVGFVDLFGEPVYAYIKSRRLEQARRILESGEVSVAGAAHAIGYQPGHFATEFRRKFGMPPSALTGRIWPRTDDHDGQPMGSAPVIPDLV